MTQYIDLCNRILTEGNLVENKRTGKKCLTVINADLTYDVGANYFPLDTTRKSYWKSAVAEIIGYLRGYNNANDFAELGTKTWLANANENQEWLNNPHRKGDGDMGLAYRFRDTLPENDQFLNIYKNLINRNDDRGLIMTAWKPETFDRACLRPCMHSYQFSVVGDTLHLNATQRSCDVPLGLNFNQVQVFFLLFIMAEITGLKAGKAYHKIVNAHIYEDQVDLMKDQVSRIPYDMPLFGMKDNKRFSLDDLLNTMTPDDFVVSGYNCHPAIKYPFSV